MINDDTRQTVKFIIWVVTIVIVCYFASIAIFYFSGKTVRTNDQQMKNVAINQTPITDINKYYHLDRGTNSYALAGKDKKQNNYYFIYLPKRKKAFLYEAKKGFTEKEITDKFKTSYPKKTINIINLGWYEGAPVWEVSYKNPNDKIGYLMYNFKNGTEINKVDNL